nr:uncharacterized protein LOC104116826 isoform X2 [Nicotiana tomentosiformis]
MGPVDEFGGNGHRRVKYSKRWLNKFGDSRNLILRLWISMLRRNRSQYRGSLPENRKFPTEIYCRKFPTESAGNVKKISLVVFRAAVGASAQSTSLAFFPSR